MWKLEGIAPVVGVDACHHWVEQPESALQLALCKLFLPSVLDGLPQLIERLWATLVDTRLEIAAFQVRRLSRLRLAADMRLLVYVGSL